MQQRHPAHAAAGVCDPLVQETPGQTLPLLRAQHPKHRGGLRACTGSGRGLAPVDGDLLQVEQHGPGVRPAAPLARLGQLVAAGAPARRARPEHRGAAELVERHGEARHVPHAPRRPVPGGARVVPAAVLDTRAAGHILDRLLDAVQVEVGVVVPVMQ